jgi:hypothetical protein
VPNHLREVWRGDFPSAWTNRIGQASRTWTVILLPAQPSSLILSSESERMVRPWGSTTADSAKSYRSRHCEATTCSSSVASRWSQEVGPHEAPAAREDTGACGHGGGREAEDDDVRRWSGRPPLM